MLVGVFLTGSLVTSAQAADWKHYNNNPDFELTTLPNGAIANMQDLGRAASVLRMGIEAKAIPVTDNIWIISGFLYGPARPQGAHTTLGWRACVPSW